jgi:hypothetical protein
MLLTDSVFRGICLNLIIVHRATFCGLNAFITQVTVSFQMQYIYTIEWLVSSGGVVDFSQLGSS